MNETENKFPNKTLPGLVVIIVLALFGWFLWNKEQGAARETVSSELEAEAARLNPFTEEEAPNPFAESANPYENIKTNPFE